MWGGEGREWKVEWLDILHLDIIFLWIKTAWSLYTSKLARRLGVGRLTFLCVREFGVECAHTRLDLRPLLTAKFMRAHKARLQKKHKALKISNEVAFVLSRRSLTCAPAKLASLGCRSDRLLL